ncbi:DUF6879 family protein [Streptomyces sp. enrichment culture]|uniref:DUF6879 family protein n=1 Tax=Streptomyces sp. enrichment culture TaxID=1795815 RepID=UPI003F548D52
MPQKPPAPSFEDLLDSAQEHALHLELRDVYAVGEERDVYDAFQRDGSVPADDSDYWSGWLPLVKRTVARGVKVRRARIVSEPVTDYRDVRRRLGLLERVAAAGEADRRARHHRRQPPRRRTGPLAAPPPRLHPRPAR